MEPRVRHGPGHGDWLGLDAGNRPCVHLRDESDSGWPGAGHHDSPRLLVIITAVRMVVHLDWQVAMVASVPWVDVLWGGADGLRYPPDAAGDDLASHPGKAVGDNHGSRGHQGVLPQVTA